MWCVGWYPQEGFWQMSTNAGWNGQLAAATIQTSRALPAAGFLFSEHIKRLRRRDVLRDARKNTPCPVRGGIYFIRGKSRRDVGFKLDSVVITGALKQDFWGSRSGAGIELRARASQGGWNEGEGWAEIRDGGADGSGNLAAQVSLLYLNRPAELR